MIIKKPPLRLKSKKKDSPINIALPFIRLSAKIVSSTFIFLRIICFNFGR